MVDFTLVRDGTNSQAIVEDLPLSVSLRSDKGG